MRAVVALLLAACNPAIRAEDYDQSCALDSDCVVVEAGPVCNSCGCQNAAIHIDELQRFNDDFLSARFLCFVPGPIDCAACVEAEAFCDDGTCASRAVTP